MYNSKQISNAQENEQVGTIANAPKVKIRKKAKAPFHAIREKAANIYKSQLTRGVDTIRLSIDRALGLLASADYTKDRFLAEFKMYVDRLLDSRRFEKECEELKLIPLNVATHVVFDGMKKINDVLVNGIKPTYSNCLKELVNPIYTVADFEKAITSAPQDCSVSQED